MADNWFVDWTVIVNGVDITSKMAPLLISVSTTDKDGAAGDTCQIVLDDTDGQVMLPVAGGVVVVMVKGIITFDGVVDEVKSTGTRDGGRKIHVGAKGFDSRGKAKEGLSFHLDNKTLGEFMKKAAQKAGYTIKVHKELAKIRRDHWAADNESFLHLGQRMAREFHAIFKIRGKKSTLVPKGLDLGLPIITAQAGSGGNIIRWDITPIISRKVYKKARVRYFDRNEAKYKYVEVDYNNPKARAVNNIRSPAKDRDQAKKIGEARKRESERYSGTGTLELDIEPMAMAEGFCTVTGTRPGVDGIYRITSVTHKVSRGAGSTTMIELKQPGGAAGKDSRA